MARQPIPTPKEEENFLMKNIWFYAFFFFLLMAIASFGLIAEA